MRQRHPFYDRDRHKPLKEKSAYVEVLIQYASIKNVIV